MIMLDGKEGEAYNIGTEKNYISIRELAQRLVELFPEKKLKAVLTERKDEGYAASPERLMSRICFKKLKELGWTPYFSIEDGFRRVVDYFSEQKT